eukprot:scaffold15622_cov150-Amphora_coffeaeformis.AAC.1
MTPIAVFVLVSILAVRPIGNAHGAFVVQFFIALVLHNVQQGHCGNEEQKRGGEDEPNVPGAHAVASRQGAEFSHPGSETARPQIIRPLAAVATAGEAAQRDARDGQDGGRGKEGRAQSQSDRWRQKTIIVVQIAHVVRHSHNLETQSKHGKDCKKFLLEKRLDCILETTLQP